MIYQIYPRSFQETNGDGIHAIAPEFPPAINDASRERFRAVELRATFGKELPALPRPRNGPVAERIVKRNGHHAISSWAVDRSIGAGNAHCVCLRAAHGRKPLSA